MLPLFNRIITACESKLNSRRLVIRAIEDGIVFLGMGVVVWTVCTILSALVRLLGVA